MPFVFHCATCFFYFQGLVFEEERPPPPNRAPLAPMLEFVSAQTGVPVVAVGGGASLGREPQVKKQARYLTLHHQAFLISFHLD